MTSFKTCETCGGCGMVINITGEPDDCPDCNKGTTPEEQEMAQGGLECRYGLAQAARIFASIADLEGAKEASDWLLKQDIPENKPSTPPSIQVKPLEWEELGSHWFEAKTYAKTYCASKRHDGYRASRGTCFLGDTYATEALAKAACDADHEERIRSSIVGGGE